MLHLSKTKYMKGVQCPKRLWLSVHQPCIPVGAGGECQTDDDVYVLARKIFGAYKQVSVDTDDFASLVKETRLLIQDGHAVIADGVFSCQDLSCKVDLVKNLGNDQVEIYCIKRSTGVKQSYLEEIAFQRYVLTLAGYEVKKSAIIHLRRSYVRHGELDLQELFYIADVTERTALKHLKVRDRIAMLNEYMQQEAEPEKATGQHCHNPYTCEYWSCCSAGDIRPPMEIKEKLDLKSIGSFLDQLSYPLYFLDFETIFPAIPMFDDSRPYMQIPFQFSLHWLDSERGVPQHREYLAPADGSDPRNELAKQLCAAIPENVCTLAYFDKFERGRIRELAELFPQYADHLMNIHDHMIDLYKPFGYRWYWTKEMKGSASLKSVLPALFPDDSSLDYSKLEEVQNGGDASSLFLRMIKDSNLTAEEIDTMRTHLLAYCKLDTWAMVKIWQKLLEVTGRI